MGVLRNDDIFNTSEINTIYTPITADRREINRDQEYNAFCLLLSKNTDSKSFENELKMTECHKFIHGYVARTFPSKIPLLSLDRIYIKNFKIISSMVLHPKEEISDHLPIFCELEII